MKSQNPFMAPIINIQCGTHTTLTTDDPFLPLPLLTCTHTHSLGILSLHWIATAADANAGYLGQDGGERKN